MEQTMLEYLTKVGREMERRTQLDDAVSSLRKVLRRLKIDPSPYEARFAKLASAGQVTDLSVGVATAEDPVAYLRDRLGARSARPRPRRRTAAKS